MFTPTPLNTYVLVRHDGKTAIDVAQETVFPGKTQKLQLHFLNTTLWSFLEASGVKPIALYLGDQLVHEFELPEDDEGEEDGLGEERKIEVVDTWAEVKAEPGEEFQEVDTFDAPEPVEAAPEPKKPVAAREIKVDPVELPPMAELAEMPEVGETWTKDELEDMDRDEILQIAKDADVDPKGNTRTLISRIVDAGVQKE